MSFKTKAFGFITGTALTLSLASGVMAADGPTSATLLQKTGGACYASTVAGSGIDLGDWEWNGSAYVLTPNTTSGSITFNITQDKRPTPNVNCAISVTVSDLTQSTNVIPSTNVTLTATAGTSSTGSPYTVSTPKGTGANLALTASLGTSIPNDIPEGLYSGTVTVSSASASN